MRTLSAEMRAERRKKAIYLLWQEWGKPFLIALLMLPILYILVVGFLFVAQPIF